MSSVSKSMVKLDGDGVIRDQDGIPTSIRIFKVGDNWDCRGDNAIYNPKDAERIMSANTRGDGSMPFDVGHGTLAGSSAPPESHESYGWGMLRCDDTGVWIDNIKWEDDMRRKLRSRKFRFVSPAFRVGKGFRISDLLSVALTNVPATEDAEAIVLARQKRTSGINTTKRHIPMGNNMADETIGREDGAEDDKDKEVERADDEGMDLSSIDVDGLSEEEAKALCVKLIDRLADMQSEAREDDGENKEDDDDEEDEETKRDIVSALFTERLIRFAQVKPFKELSLRDLVKEERRLRANKPVARAAVKAAEKADKAEKPFENEVATQLRDVTATPALGATDEMIERHLAQFGHSYETLGFTKRKGAVYGANITSMARNHDNKKAH